MKQWKCPSCGSEEGVREHYHPEWVEAPIRKIEEHDGVIQPVYAGQKIVHGTEETFMYTCNSCGLALSPSGTMKDDPRAGDLVVDTFDGLVAFIEAFC